MDWNAQSSWIFSNLQLPATIFQYSHARVVREKNTLGGHRSALRINYSVWAWQRFLFYVHLETRPSPTVGLELFEGHTFSGVAVEK